MNESNLRKLIREEVSRVLKPIFKELGAIIAESRKPSASELIYGPGDNDYGRKQNISDMRSNMKKKLGISENSAPNNPIDETSSGEKFASGQNILEWYGNGNNGDPSLQELDSKGQKVDEYLKNLYG